MPFSMRTLLLHHVDVPEPARHALQAANDAPPSARARHLESAARILYDLTELDCADARELVDLPLDAEARCGSLAASG